MADPIFGRLTWDNITFAEFAKNPTMSEAVASGAGMVLVLGAVVTLIALTWFRLWGPLWRDWITSVDHKKIGIMYLVLALVMFARGIIEGVVMRINQATAYGGDGFLTAEHVGELFSTHGTIMIFFVAMPLIAGFINYLVPLQIGARDMAFPVMNQVSLGLTTTGAALLMISLVVGQFETGGWTAYPPFTGKEFSPGEGPDYWIWAIFFSGIGSLLSGINFTVTIYKLRAPGMTYWRMPLFTWTALITSILMVFALPPVTVSTLMLAADRYLDFHFFTNDLGGNMMNYANLFWMFGHPEVYILILPAYGVLSEISATFSGKRLYGYSSLVIATMCIAVLSFTVWLHHFFTMGQDANVNAAFGIATLLIAIPTGVKVYDWVATLYGGRIRMTVPMIYLTGFFFLFVIGGLSGVILANPTIDFQVHNSLFIVAHFHNAIIPGVVFGLLAGVHYWFPKAFGFRLHEGLGALSAWLWIIGFILTFMPLYVLGLMGMPRRSANFDDAAFQPYMNVAAVGALVILTAFLTLAACIVVSILMRRRLAVPLGDPWDGRTLEWATSSPPPPWNFAHIPEINDRDAFAVEKEKGTPFARPTSYQDIQMPAPTATGLVVMVLTTALAFALVWWIWWLAALCAALVVVTVIVHGSTEMREITIPAAEVARVDQAWLNALDASPGVTRDDETDLYNRGRARPDMVPAE